MKRVLRGAEYDITIKNPNGVQKGVKTITVNGKLIDGNIIQASEGKHIVEVVMG